MSAGEIAQLAARRSEMGLTLAELAASAGFTERYVWGLLKGGRAASREALARLALALSATGLRQGTGADFDGMIAYRAALALAAQALGYEAAAMQGQDPARRATADPRWMRAAEARRIAVYVLNCGCGLPQARVGRLAGLTKQAVSLAVREIEDRRSDPDFNDMLDRLTAAITGEA